METLKKILLIGLGVTFILSAILKTISVYSFSQTVNSFCGLLGMDVLYGYGFPLAIVIIAFELLIGVCAFIRRFQRFIIWIYTIVLGFFTYITYINYTDLYGGIESCGCFGELIYFTPVSSYYKNIAIFVLSLILLSIHLIHTFTWQKLKYGQYLLLVLFLSSCHNQLDNALELAGDNRAELEKVLEHFKDDPDQLKYEAACFLIENMPYHGTFYGKKLQKYIMAYDVMGAEPKEKRVEKWNELSKKIDMDGLKYAPDVRKMKAGYLIRAINEAVDTWNASSWSKDYDKSVFFDYVLPYRVSNEPLSYWRTYIKETYPYMSDNTVWSVRGPQIVAAQSELKNAEVVDETSALHGKMVLLTKPQSCVTFKIEAPVAGRKLIRFRYNTQTRKAKAAVTLNGKSLGYLHLEPTFNQHTFRNTRFGLRVDLRRGMNELTVAFSGDTIRLDYIMVSSMETIDTAKTVDYSSYYCVIQNKMTGRCVSMDTLAKTMLKPVELKRYSTKDNTLLLRMDYLGFATWRIAPKDSTDMCLEDRWVSLDTLAPVGKYNYIRSNHQKWVIIPIEDGLCKIMNKDTGMFWEVSKDKDTGKDIVVQNIYMGKDNQKWRIAKKGKNPIADHFFRVGSATSQAVKVTDMCSQFEFIGQTGGIPPTLIQLCRQRTGKCRDESAFQQALARSMGIPTAIDFTPHWGNRTNSHAWSVLILPDGKGTPFYMGCVPGDTAQYFHPYLKPKIFRHRFHLNMEMMKDFVGEESVYPLFKQPDWIDVTDEYYQTTDVVRTIPEKYKKHKVAYICVSDRESWEPVYYGKILDGKATFKSMGRNILYIAAVMEGMGLKTIGNPFYITADGKVKMVRSDKNKKQSMTLLRKYPFFGKEDYFNFRMSYGKIQGSNEATFKKPVTLFTHEGITEGCWYERKLKEKRAFRYARYLGPNGSYCNINELEFYDEKGKKLKGRTLGTEGVENQRKETVFDGDVLTGFQGVSPDGHWVGLAFERPVTLSKVKYMPRNDGNTVEIGDVYELKMFVDGCWKLLATKKASENQITFDNVPVGGLYMLSDKTKGVEERPFTYVKNKQIWW